MNVHTDDALGRRGRLALVPLIVIMALATAASAQSRRQPQLRQRPQQPSPQRQQPQQQQAPPQQQREQAPQGEQPAAEPMAEAGSMLLFREAYQRTRAAHSADAFSEVIDLCQRGLAGGGSEAEMKYGRDLLAWSYNKRGEMLADDGHEEEALSDFETSIKLDPGRWQAYHNRGVSYGVMGDYQSAMDDFNRVLHLNPKHAKAYYNRGEVRYKLGDIAGAVADYGQCLKLNPNDAAAYTSRAFAYASAHDYRSAINDYSKAIQADPTDAEAYIHRADAYADLGDFGRALTDYQAGVRANPKYSRAHQGLAWLRSTCPVPQFRNASFALESAEKAIELADEETYLLLDTLAAAQANANKFDDAKTTQAKAIALAPAGGALAEEIEAMQQRLALYEKGDAFRTTPVSAPPAAASPVASQPPNNRPPARSSVQPRGRTTRGRPR
jgi:tetratricopeptide (TPR) repeat protein